MSMEKNNSKEGLSFTDFDDSKYLNMGPNKKFESQMRIAAKSFFERPKTMLEVSEETGILRANLCRYVAKWKKLKLIKIVRFSFCSISLHKAARYSTNPEYWNKSTEK